MRKKLALIVDDSRTAREILARRLAAYDIEVIKVDSAANAIDYLFTNIPDAVFMDYEMPGMDGFQALRVIKSNPNTATVPVMMYTSKAGDLALGEARALGAIGVLPKQTGGQDLDAVVAQLHLLPEQISLVESFHQHSEQHQMDAQSDYPSQPPANVEYLDDVRPKQERVEYPGEVYDESLFVLKRQTRMFQKELGLAEQRLKDCFTKEFIRLRDDLEAVELRFKDLISAFRWKLNWSMGGNLLAVVLLGTLWWKLAGLNITPQLAELSADLSSEINQVNQALSSLERSVAVEPLLNFEASDDSATMPRPQTTIELMQWAANRGTEFQYGENPYGDLRILWLAELVQQLTKVGFQGVINLQAHYGNFCLTRTETGSLTLAGEQLPFKECIFSSKTDDTGFAQSSYQTIGFANFIKSLGSDADSSIEVYVEGDASQDPIVSYPETYTVKTAGEWNRVAAQNQRIQVSLFQRTGL